ncbi:membrane protein insertase YidC [Actimicrobium sp. CCC2.4]|uniref:membrane protein insertase YidC n=1 Tax=Actimicrobium sp. CCC2.4 TaxID=3048606 RepID=UPI002AC957CF|nr:membrane protein insertase YidC [Actimicrobium sp. CCC2.4]MEB0135935.1 membrane protein insertase YidC [Actimicrobium sp. CCC2.4]WPX32601.1 membrane protein insertase YidC [Actimicrobium sp. CCC2.4]
MDIRRTVLWVVFSLSLLMLWDKWQQHNGKPPMLFPGTSEQAKPADTGPANANSAALPTPATAPGTAIGVDAANIAATTKGETITITTDIFKADIDTQGGELKRLELLKHKDTIDKTKNIVLFDNSTSRTYLAETGLIGGAFPSHKTLFVARPGGRTMDASGTLQLVLDADQGGVKLTKTYTFKRADYHIDLKHDVTNTGATAVTPSVYLQLVRDGSKPEGESSFYSTFTGPAVYTDADKFQKLKFENIEKGSEEHASKADNGWIALIQHYFVSAIILPPTTQREIFTKKVATNLYAVGSIVSLGSIAPGASASLDTLLYSGPQESAVLERTAPGLDLVKDYGWLTIIAKPIFWLMTQIHKILGNWGWTIIVLTMLIKLAFFPLSAASYRSMAKMKMVTPKMTDIRERFKSDPQKMNQAMMALYKTEKINPLGGCLPIVVQIPVFISLYWVLLASVEMRNAPWLGWIQDLASPDPYFILPVLMAVSMFVQTKLNPKPPDPMQAKIMMFMPIIFSVMFFFFPSGLVLYWVVNNVLSIAQQWVITKKAEEQANSA